MPLHSFADRDMFMRFRGGGIGHRAARLYSRVSAPDHRANQETFGSSYDSEIEPAEQAASPEPEPNTLAPPALASLTSADVESEESDEEQPPDVAVGDGGDYSEAEEGVRVWLHRPLATPVAYNFG